MKQLILLFLIITLTACGFGKTKSEMLVTSLVNNEYSSEDDKTVVLFTASIRHTPEAYYKSKRTMVTNDKVPTVILCIDNKKIAHENPTFLCEQDVKLDYENGKDGKIYAFKTNKPMINIDGLHYMFPREESGQYNRSFVHYKNRKAISSKMGSNIYIGNFDINFIYNKELDLYVASIKVEDKYNEFIKQINSYSKAPLNIINSYSDNFLNDDKFSFENKPLKTVIRYGY